MGALGQPVDSIGRALGGAADARGRSPLYRPGGHQSPADGDPVEGQDEEAAGVPPAFDGPQMLEYGDTPQGGGITDGIPKSPIGPIVQPPSVAGIGFKIKLAIAIVAIALIGA